jgi:hypothetical protein
MCDCGSAPDRLRVLPQITVEIGCELAASINANEPGVNVGPFGQCSKGNIPCVPVFPAPWTPGSGSVVKICGERALRQPDVLVCAKGGTVKIMTPMQASTDVDP